MKIKLLSAFCIIANCLLPIANSFSQYTKLLDFDSTNGSYPLGSLISDGTFLYGMTQQGGTNDSGVVFKIKPDGTGYFKLFDFSYANGYDPRGSLIYDGTFLYGMTAYGGTNDLGVIFKIKPDGTGYSKLLDCTGSSNGSWLDASLISDGTFLYGTATSGGTNNYGVIFKIKPDGTGYAKLLDFSGISNGKAPQGSLISDGTFLYGKTTHGGTNDTGTVFKIKPDGTGYVKLLDFAGSSNGSIPGGSLISDGTFLYGMTYYGGTGTCSFGCGVIFKIKPDGTGYAKLLDFAGTSNGSNPFGDLFYDGTFLYGMTVLGGINNAGVIFKIKPDGTGYVKLLDFAGTSNGMRPYGSLISDGTFLYGMTLLGGTNGYGVIFKYGCTATITGETTICAGQNTTLTASGGASYSWSTGSTNVSIIVSPPSSTSYTVTATTGTCVATASVTVIVNPTPTASISGSTAICSGSCTTLTASGGINYSWSNGATAATIVVCPSTSATYSVITSNGICSDTASVTVTVYPLPTLSIAHTDAVGPPCCNGTATVSITGGALPYTYSWSNGCTSTSCFGLCLGTLTVVVTDANGCSQTDSVFINCAVGITENNAETDFTISPNPTSGLFQIQVAGGSGSSSEYKIEIYNVMGEKVYSSMVNGQWSMVNSQFTIDISSQPNGIYFLHFKTNEGTAVRKIVINK